MTVLVVADFGMVLKVAVLASGNYGEQVVYHEASCGKVPNLICVLLYFIPTSFVFINILHLIPHPT